MFIGKYYYSIDSKKRLAIPSKFRKALGKKAVLTIGIDNSLMIYPLNEWKVLAKKLESLPPGNSNARAFSRMVFAGAVDVQLDKLGRILVPMDLKNYAGLKKNVVIVGLSNKIEIWDEAKWEEYNKKTEVAVGDIAEGLKEFGF